MSRSLKILGIETSTARTSVAAAADGRVLRSVQLPESAKPTAALVPAIRELCRSVGWSPRELDLVCVDTGPGSYTGTRVGLTCAKTIAFAVGGQVATAMSLEVVAQRCGAAESHLEVAFDAARGQVFAARFRREGEDAWRATRELAIIAATDWARGLDPAVLVTGPALVKYRRLVPSGVRVADEACWWPRAEDVVQFGLRQFRSQPLGPFWTLEPLYLRPSAAEEKRGAAGAGC